MDLATLQLCAWINGVTGSSWCHLQDQQLGGSTRPSDFTTSHRQATSSSPLMSPWPTLPSSQPHLSPPLCCVHPCPYILPLWHQRRPGSWKMILWATVLFLTLKQFTLIARKWRLSRLPKLWKGIYLKDLSLTFNFISVISHFSSAILILAYSQIKRDQNQASVLICIIHGLQKDIDNSIFSFWTTEINFKVFQ